MWRQDVSNSQFPSGNLDEPSLIETGHLPLDSYSFPPNGPSSFGMPDFAEKLDPRNTDLDHARSQPTRTSPTNLESMSGMGTFSPGMDPVNDSTAHGFQPLDPPDLTSTVHANAETSTNHGTEGLKKPKRDFADAGVHQHHPECPRHPNASRGPRIGVAPPQADAPHTQYTSFGDWQQAVPHAHHAHTAGFDPSALTSSASHHPSMYGHDTSVRIGQESGYPANPNTLSGQVPE